MDKGEYTMKLYLPEDLEIGKVETMTPTALGCTGSKIKVAELEQEGDGKTIEIEVYGEWNKFAICLMTVDGDTGYYLVKSKNGGQLQQAIAKVEIRKMSDERSTSIAKQASDNVEMAESSLALVDCPPPFLK